MSAAFLGNLSSPPLLFFFLGAAAVAASSDLEIPNQIARFLSIYLLFAIGFKGGVALAESQISAEVILTLLAAMALSALVPLYVYLALKSRLNNADAAALAATYGSVSAVTFVTATSYLDVQGIEWGGHLVAAMALMESPAILVGILLYTHFQQNGSKQAIDWSKLLREACLNGSVFLIVGSMLIGWISGPAGMQQVSGLVSDLFLGILCLFLLDMGIVAARRLAEMRRTSTEESSGALPLMLVAALCLPLLNGALALVVAAMLELGEGDALLLVVLAASASYIAVPAAMRLSLPEANPGRYLSMSLGITFPFNILLGIPLYHAAVRWLA